MASLLGAGYESSSDEGASPAPRLKAATAIVAAPDVSLEDPGKLQLMLAKPDDTALTYNVTYENLARPHRGPANPFKSTNGNILKRKNVLTGNAEEMNLSDASFNNLHRTYQSLGYAQDPSVEGAFVGNQSIVAKYGGRDAVQLRSSKDESAVIRTKRQKKGDSSIVDGDSAYLGPWAKYTTDDEVYEEEAAAADHELASDEEWVEEGIVPTHLSAPPKEATAYAASTSDSETTAFHGESLLDYQGRTYMHIPQDLDIDLRKEPGSTQNYVPKKLIHVYKHHTKPVTSINFIPSSSHLLLSSSADSSICLWDAHHSRSLLRTFAGHTKSVTSTAFHPSGRTFLSASYDRGLKVWDTETGACTWKTTTPKTPHCLAFPLLNTSNSEFLTGTAAATILQFDTRLPPSQDPVQEYAHHLGPINTLTFVDEGRRFLSTSDDKSLRAWEYGIPVPIKLIASPELFALTRSAPHPSGKYVAYQSADNQIVVYSAGEKVRQNRKKGFRGQNTSGYAIDVDISPDGGIVASGDSAGWVCFWDWKTGKMWHKMQAGGEGSGAVTCVKWHGQESSKVATGGLDGVIRYWD